MNRKNLFKFIIVNIIGTLLRIFPFPCKARLIKLGNPDSNSPVFLTCNYRLTVEKVRRALKGIDAYLLVANSRGINVWCAAAGGHFTNHDIISALRTSGIEKLVDHRDITLPQLAATGIESSVIKEKTGWKVIWGPVYAKDLPTYIDKKFKKTPKMREVRFPWTQRIEMAVALAFPTSVVLALVVIPFWDEAVLPIISLIWGLSFSIFIFFPLYRKKLVSGGKRVGFVPLDFGRGGFQLILWAILMICIVAYSFLFTDFAWTFIFRWGLISFVIILMLSIDLMGSTPIYKGCFHEDRLLEIVLNRKRCKGVGFCEQVCPRNCYEVDRNRKTATIPRKDQCVQCGACIVQCPFDALYFKSPKGEIVHPETIRKFKLNLIGTRLVKMNDKNTPS